MDEAISRQEVIKKLDEALERITKDVSKESDVYHLVYGTIGITKCMIMTIQPEIVRCKDCYNWDMSWDTDMPNCHFCAVVGNVRNAEEFCSFAERRE